MNTQVKVQKNITECFLTLFRSYHCHISTSGKGKTNSHLNITNPFKMFWMMADMILCPQISLCRIPLFEKTYKILSTSLCPINPNEYSKNKIKNVEQEPRYFLSYFSTLFIYVYIVFIYLIYLHILILAPYFSLF